MCISINCDVKNYSSGDQQSSGNPICRKQRAGSSVDLQDALHNASYCKCRDRGVIETAGNPAGETSDVSHGNRQEGKRSTCERDGKGVDHAVGVHLMAEKLINGAEQSAEQRGCDVIPSDPYSLSFFIIRYIQCRSRSFP